MKIYDISWPIDNTSTTYKDKKNLNIGWVASWDKDLRRESSISIGSHTGTHIDAPGHFLKDNITVDSLDLNNFCGVAKILDLSNINNNFISDLDLKKFDINSKDTILLKTKNSDLAYNSLFNKDFVYLAKSGAEYLASKNIKTIGIDYLGIERNQKDHDTHKILFKNEINIIEGLRLKNIDLSFNNYKLICLPLNIIGYEAAPARAILIKD